MSLIKTVAVANGTIDFIHDQLMPAVSSALISVIGPQDRTMEIKSILCINQAYRQPGCQMSYKSFKLF